MKLVISILFLFSTGSTVKLPHLSIYEACENIEEEWRDTIGIVYTFSNAKRENFFSESGKGL